MILPNIINYRVLKNYGIYTSYLLQTLKERGFVRVIRHEPVQMTDGSISEPQYLVTINEIVVQGVRYVFK